MYIVHMLIEQSKFARPKENAPHGAGHYLSLVARGGIEPPTQGFSTLKIIVFDSRNIAEPCGQTRWPIRTETHGSEWNRVGLGGLDRIQAKNIILFGKLFFNFNKFLIGISRTNNFL